MKNLCVLYKFGYSRKRSTYVIIQIQKLDVTDPLKKYSIVTLQEFDLDVEGTPPSIRDEVSPEGTPPSFRDDVSPEGTPTDTSPEWSGAEETEEEVLLNCHF